MNNRTSGVRRTFAIAGLVAMLIALASPGAARADSYHFIVNNLTGGNLRVELKGLECIHVPASFTMSASHKSQDVNVETDVKGDCAVLHRPSKFEMVLRGSAPGAEHTIVWQKWALAPWGWTQSRSAAAGLHISVHNQIEFISVH